MPLFQWISYKDGESCVSYKLNDSLMEYLLVLKHNFTQIKFKDIQQMKSAYSIRIYTMLVSELKQNRQNLKISIAVLQNILEVPKSLEIWDNFKQKVLNQATKDINDKSNIILLEIKTFKTGIKITEIEFIFDYKNNDKHILRDKAKQKHFNDKFIEVLDTYSGKSFVFEKLVGTFQYYGWKYANEYINQIVAVFERISDKKFFYIAVKNFKNDINILEQCKNEAEELF